MRSQALADECLSDSRALGDVAATAATLNLLGCIAQETGDYPLARTHLQEAIELWRELDHPKLAVTQGNLAEVELQLGDADVAAALSEEAITRFRGLGLSYQLTGNLARLGEIRLTEGDPVRARSVLDESLALSRTHRNALVEGRALHGLALVAEVEGDLAEAGRLAGEALTRQHQIGHRPGLAASLEVLAGLVVSADATLSARLLGAADELRRRHRVPVPPVWRPRWQHVMTRIHEDLSADAVAVAWREGQSAALDAVVADALAIDVCATAT